MQFYTYVNLHAEGCFIVFHFLMFFSYNKCVSLRYIQLSLVTDLPPFSGKSCRFCLPYVHLMAPQFYLFVFPFGVGGLMWIWLYQFLISLIYIEREHLFWKYSIILNDTFKILPDTFRTFVLMICLLN